MEMNRTIVFRFPEKSIEMSFKERVIFNALRAALNRIQHQQKRKVMFVEDADGPKYETCNPPYQPWDYVNYEVIDISFGAHDTNAIGYVPDKVVLADGIFLPSSEEAIYRMDAIRRSTVVHAIGVDVAHSLRRHTGIMPEVHAVPPFAAFEFAKEWKNSILVVVGSTYDDLPTTFLRENAGSGLTFKVVRESDDVNESLRSVQGCSFNAVVHIGLCKTQKVGLRLVDTYASGIPATQYVYPHERTDAARAAGWLIPNQYTGFTCTNLEEFTDVIDLLENDPVIYKRVAIQTAKIREFEEQWNSLAHLISM